jgi:uncharacterized protein (DUF2267 family)
MDDLIFGELHDRLTPQEAGDLAAQLPDGLKRLWQAQDRPGRRVERTHAADFVARAVRTVFGQLQKLLGSPTGKEDEAWDIFSQLPKNLKKLWLAAAERTAV